MIDQPTETPAQEPANEHVVKMLEQMLANAKSGKLKGAAVLQVHGPGMFGPLIAPVDQWMLEYHASAGMLMTTIEGMWAQQVNQQIEQAQQQAASFRKTLVRAPADALNGLPTDLFRKKK